MNMCKRCGYSMEQKDAYCPMCGNISDIIKSNTSGQLFVAVDKIVPLGIVFITIGVSLFSICLIIFHRIIPIVFGLSFAICSIGVILLSKYKSALNFARSKSTPLNTVSSNGRCKYCYNGLYANANYCTLCGSRNRHKK